MWEAGTSGGNAGVRAANHVDTRALIGGPRDVEADRRIEAGSKRRARRQSRDTGDIPTIRQNSESLAVESPPQLRKIVSVVDSAHMPAVGTLRTPIACIVIPNQRIE